VYSRIGSLSRGMSSVLQNGRAMGQESVGLVSKTAKQILLCCPVFVLVVYK